MKKTVAVLLMTLSSTALSQQISCESVTSNYSNINYPEHVMFNMTSANTPFIFMTKPKGLVNITTAVLGNGTTNVPDTYSVVRATSYDDTEWDAWATTENLPNTNRTSFHIVGSTVRGQLISGAMVGDAVNIYVKGYSSNNTYNPSQTLAHSFQTVLYRNSGEFNDLIVVDDIVAGERTTVSMGRLTRGIASISSGGVFSDTSAFGNVISSTSNQNVLISLTTDTGIIRGISSKHAQLTTSSGTIYAPYLDPTEPAELLATITPKNNASGEYSQTFTVTVTCP